MPGYGMSKDKKKKLLLTEVAAKVKKLVLLQDSRCVLSVKLSVLVPLLKNV